MESQQNQNQEKNNPLNTYARYSNIAFKMVAIIGIGVYGGVKLDEKYPNKYKLFTIILSLFSIGVALYIVIRQVQDSTKKQENSNDKSNP